MARLHAQGGLERLLRLIKLAHFHPDDSQRVPVERRQPVHFDRLVDEGQRLVVLTARLQNPRQIVHGLGELPFFQARPVRGLRQDRVAARKLDGSKDVVRKRVPRIDLEQSLNIQFRRLAFRLLHVQFQQTLQRVGVVRTGSDKPVEIAARALAIAARARHFRKRQENLRGRRFGGGQGARRAIHHLLVLGHQGKHRPGAQVLRLVGHHLQQDLRRGFRIAFQGIQLGVFHVHVPRGSPHLPEVIDRRRGGREILLAQRNPQFSGQRA